MLSELFHLGARLRGLLDEMVHEAWQATLSFWANERWRKFVYSHLALLGITWHHLASLGITWHYLAKFIFVWQCQWQINQTRHLVMTAHAVSCWDESLWVCLVMLNSDPSLFDYAVCARIEPFWLLTPLWHRWIANVKMWIPHIYCLNSAMLNTWLWHSSQLSVRSGEGVTPEMVRDNIICRSVTSGYGSPGSLRPRDAQGTIDFDQVPCGAWRNFPFDHRPVAAVALP